MDAHDKWDATSGLRCVADGCDRNARSGMFCARHAGDMDAHDEAAKALMPDCGCNSAAFYRCTKCDGTGEKRCDRDDLANALRKAAADERHAILLMVQDEINPADTGRDSYHYASCAEALFLRIQARAKGGATSVPASGIHERAEGHPKSCTCSYCEVGR